MKNKIKPILVVLIIFGAILGFNYYTNAAENLKTLQEKYKISYNNLTKALKEGADQEHIDKLSARCKEDYAEYQKAAKDSGGFENKTNIQPVKTNSEPRKNEPVFEAPVPMIQFKQIKIKVNGNDRLVRIPFINPEFAKKNPPDKRLVRITAKPSPRRIGGPSKVKKVKSGKYYEVPCSYELFGYPLDESDKFRCSGEEKIYELYSLIAAQTPDNFSEGITKIMILQYEIMEKYGNYPDICALAQLYGADAFEKQAKDSGYFKYFYSTSSSYFGYSQIGRQYEHLKGSNEAMKNILSVIDDRKKEIKANDQALIEQNKEFAKEIQKYAKEIEKIQKMVYGKPNEESMNGFAKDIANNYSWLCYNYSRIYDNLMKANEKEQADSIFKIVKNDDNYVLSGKLYDAYLEVPPELPFKYSYSACAPPPTANTLTKLSPTRDCPYGEITTSGEVKVKMYRDASMLLRIVKESRDYQILDKEDVIESDGRSRNERRTLDLCDYLNTFTPSQGDGQKIAPEKISKEQLAEYKNNAYSNIDNSPEYADFYKRKPHIKELYFSGNENTKLPETKISSPEEYSTIRAKIDYQQPFSPDYAIQARVYTVKTFQSEDTPPNPGPVAFNRSTSEPQIDRQKFVALIPDAIFGGYYAKFLVNENTAGDDTPGPVPAKKVKDKFGKTKTKVVWPELIKRNEDELKESLSFVLNSYELEQSLVSDLYLSNGYFKNKKNSIERNILGCFNNMFKNYDKIIIPEINTEAIASGGMQWVFVDMETKVVQKLYRNQADWFIVFSHGSISDSSGGIAIAKEDGHKDFSVAPWELIKNIGTPQEKSEYSEDMDVLFLLGCRCLSVDKTELNGSANPDYSFAWGWNKVLPKGLILGFYWYSHDKTNRFLLMALNRELNKLAMQGQQATNEWLINFWKTYNKNAYMLYLNAPTYKNLKGEVVKNELFWSSSAAYIYNGKQTQYKIHEIKNNIGKIVDVDFEDITTDLNE